MISQQFPACPYCRHSWLISETGLLSCPSCRRALLLASAGNAAPDTFLVPQEVGAYQLTPSEGNVAGHTLFPAEQRGTAERAAVKFLPRYLAAPASARNEVDRRLQLLQGMTQTNQLRILDQGIEAGLRYYVREWVDGTDLATAMASLQSHGQIPRFNEIYPLFQQLCQNLQEWHDAGIAHGRIKLSSLLRTPDGKLRLLDPAWPLPVDREGITDTVRLPWQREDVSLDTKADIYAAGAATYELLTGVPPGSNPRPPSLVNVSVPAWFDALVLEMLHQDPLMRPSSIGPLAARQPVREVAGPSRGIERLATAVAGALVGALAGAVTASVMHASALVGGLIGMACGSVIALVVGAPASQAGPKQFPEVGDSFASSFGTIQPRPDRSSGAFTDRPRLG